MAVPICVLTLLEFYLLLNLNSKFLDLVLEGWAIPKADQPTNAKFLKSKRIIQVFPRLEFGPSHNLPQSSVRFTLLVWEAALVIQVRVLYIVNQNIVQERNVVTVNRILKRVHLLETGFNDLQLDRALRCLPPAFLHRFVLPSLIFLDPQILLTMPNYVLNG